MFQELTPEEQEKIERIIQEIDSEFNPDELERYLEEIEGTTTPDLEISTPPQKRYRRI